MEPTNLDQDPDIDADYFLFFYDSQQGVGNRKIDPLPTLPDPNSSDRQYLLPALDTTSQFLSERLTTHTTHEISKILKRTPSAIEPGRKLLLARISASLT